MRVLTYLHSYEPGGLERDVLRFNKAWAERGIDVHIALGRPEGPLAAEAPDVPMTVLQQGRFSTARFETLWMIWHLPRVIRAVRPDVVFCAGNSYTIVAVAIRLLLGRACPPVVLRISNDLVRRDMLWPVRMAYRVWLRLQAPFFAAIVAMAEPARAEILEYMHADPKQVVAIDNGSMLNVDVDRLARVRHSTPRTHEGRHYLGVGRLAAQKNFELLVEAFARIAKPEDRLTIVGEGPRRASIAARAAALGVAAQLEMPGHRSPVDSYFARADALVMSSDYEGLGIVLLEALAAGLPVVATDCGPNMAMLVEGAGRLVPVRDADALADAMTRIVTDPVDVGAMRSRARAFTVEASADEWITLFTRVAGQKPALPGQPFAAVR